MVELRRIGQHTGCRILVKLEGLNPGGSVKTRTAYWMIAQAENRGKVGLDSILVEATSGNQGIGVAMVGAAMGIKVRIVMPENMSRERRSLLRAYGADVVLTPVGRDVRETFLAAVDTARRMAEEDPKVFWVNQFANPDNADAHRRFTAPEILRQSGGRVDGFVSGIGTGGTITGVGEVLKQTFPRCRIVAAEPANASFFRDGKIGLHIQQGIGDGLVPEILNRAIIDGFVSVTDDDALATARALAAKEGMFAGISSGTNVWASVKVAEELGPGHTVVALLPDGGEKYLSAGIVERED